MNKGLFQLRSRWIGATAGLLLALAACDPGGRLDQLTPQPPPATPLVLGVTAEAPGIGAVATSGPEQPLVTVDAPILLPTPTYDASRPAWTILYYASADSPRRTGFVWDDLNEFEAAGPTDQVQVIAQIDWPADGPAGSAEAIRYKINPDTDTTQAASEAVATLGEVNMGDPAELAEFVSWAIATYPANRYALFLGDFGGGWRGCCFDESTGATGESDHLSLTDIDQALANAAGQTGARLEVIALAAGLMSDLDVLQTVQSHASFAVASAGLMPGSAWDYTAVLSQLNADPLVDGRQLAGDLVTAFVNYQRQVAGDESVGMAAVDLGRVPAVSAAVETLALTLGNDPALHGAIAAEGRRGAQQYGAAAGNASLISVDLLQAAAIIAESAPPGELQTAATAISSAVAESLVAYDHGLGLPAGRGVAIYWPATPADFDPLYNQVTRLPSWAAYLAAAEPAAAAMAPRVTVDSAPRDPIHIANPALMRSEVTGQRLSEVALVADQEAADGRRVLRQYQPVEPAPLTLPGGTNATFWRDGRHESLIIWDATAAYLADAAGAGDFVVLRPVDPSSIGSQLIAAGRFRPGGGEVGLTATAVFNEFDAAAQRLWTTAAVSSGTNLVGEVGPLAGDVFQVDTLFVRPDGATTAEPGVALVFDDAPAIYRSTRPLPAGRYAVGMRTQLPTGESVQAVQPLTVDPAGAAAGFRAFVDAGNNAQFLYPADWLPPVPQEEVTFTSNISGTAQMQIRYYPGWTADLAALQAEVLTTFGEVSILLQEPTVVGAESVPAQRTAYGYESADQGARTGMFLTFLKDNVGYVVDLDAPRDQEAATLATINTVAATWQFLAERLGFGPESWSALNIGNYRLSYPNRFAYQEFNNWHRFAADARTFVAVRIQPAGRSPAEAMTGLLQTAAEGVAGFTADEPQRLFYGGYLWERNDFRYTDADGANVAGLLLSRVEGETEIAVWAEASDPAEELLQTVFLPVAASIELIPPPPSG